MTNEELGALYQLGGVLGVVAIGGVAGLRWVVGRIKDLPLTGPTKREETTIVTADSVAMRALATSVEANTMAVIGNTQAIDRLNTTAADVNKVIIREVAERERDEEARELKVEVERLVAERMAEEGRRRPIRKPE